MINKIPGTADAAGAAGAALQWEGKAIAKCNCKKIAKINAIVNDFIFKIRKFHFVAKYRQTVFNWDLKFKLNDKECNEIAFYTEIMRENIIENRR